MVQESAFEFVARVQRDSNFRREYLKAKSQNAGNRFLDEMGFDFNLAELQVARRRMSFSEPDRELLRDMNDVLQSSDAASDPDSFVVAMCGCNQPTNAARPGNLDRQQQNQQIRQNNTKFQKPQFDPKMKQQQLNTQKVQPQNLRQLDPTKRK